MTKETHLLLQGIVGSTAYGLSTPDSDVDRMGVFAFPTSVFLGLRLPGPKQLSEVSAKPDVTLHEVAKFAGLALKCNPSMLELLWLPERLYEHRTELGWELVQMRESFLSGPMVRNAYFGYARTQFERLKRRGDGTFSADTRKRTAKHARHLARLLDQGGHLYHHGDLQVQVDDPDWYHRFGTEVAQGNRAMAEEYLEHYRSVFDRAGVLPAQPDEEKVDEWVRKVRNKLLIAK